MTWRGRYETLRRVGVGQVALARAWIAFNGDDRVHRRLRVPQGGLVIDVGAYEGEFTALARSDFGAEVIAIEPIPEFVSKLESRFASDESVSVLPGALGAASGRVTLQVAADGSSAWIDGASPVEVASLDVAEVVGEHHLDLLKMNAEGAEFDVLERLIATDQIRQVGTILVQFHKYVPEAHGRRKAIRHLLRRTHRCSVNVPWVWELWRRR